MIGYRENGEGTFFDPEICFCKLDANKKGNFEFY